MFSGTTARPRSSPACEIRPAESLCFWRGPLKRNLPVWNATARLPWRRQIWFANMAPQMVSDGKEMKLSERRLSPCRLPSQTTWRNELSVNSLLCCWIAFALLVALNVVLYFAVVRPVRSLAAMSDWISKGNLEFPELPVRGNDEISALAAAFNRMHRSLSKAMTMLEQKSDGE